MNFFDLVPFPGINGMNEAISGVTRAKWNKDNLGPTLTYFNNFGIPKKYLIIKCNLDRIDKWTSHRPFWPKAKVFSRPFQKVAKTGDKFQKSSNCTRMK